MTFFLYTYIVLNTFRGIIMKKLMLILMAMTIVLQAYGVLEGSKDELKEKICFYSDGTTIVVSLGHLCPVTNGFRD